MALTTKQEKFVLVWYETGNKSEAYRQAYSGGNMSAVVVANKASALSKKGDVRVRYEALQNEAKEKHAVTVERLIQEYSKIAFADLSGLVDEKGRPLPPSKLPNELKSVVGVEVKDKLKALADLGRYLGLFEKDNAGRSDIYIHVPDDGVEDDWIDYAPK